MTARKTKRRSRFGAGLLIYIILFLILSIVALIFFYDWLEAYEKAQPYNSVDAFAAELQKNGPTSACMDSLDEIDDLIQPESEQYDFLSELLSGAKLVRSPAKSTPEELAYSVKVDDGTVGTIFFRQTGETEMGHTAWEKSREEYDFSAYYRTADITAPEDYSVQCNGIVLGSGYITERGIPFETLSQFYDQFPGLPCLVTYTTGITLGEPELAILDRDGNPVPEESRTEEQYLDTCSTTVKERLSSFVREYASTYVQFTADVNGGHYYYFNLLAAMTEHEGTLYERMQQSLQSFGFTTTRSCTIMEDAVNLCTPLDSTHYLVLYSYTTETVGRDYDSSLDTRSLRFVLSEETGSLLVESMSYY